LRTVPSVCPICGGQITVTRLYCPECDTTIEGRFTGRSFAQLAPEQMDFIETFLRCEGKINRVEKELNLSYPTIRNRLHEVIHALGYELGAEEETERLSDVERQSILEDLEAGKISADEALNLLQERGG